MTSFQISLSFFVVVVFLPENENFCFLTGLVFQANDSSESLERKGHPLEEGSKASFKGSTALLVELEDKVAQAAANVQNAQSEVRVTLKAK